MKQFLILLLCVVGLVGCVDLEFDEPPACCDNNITANATIKQLKDLYKGANVEVTEDWIIEAVVAADDEFGNFYKGVIIQDETAAIEIRVEMNNLYSFMPQGRKVFIKTKGMYVTSYSGNLQLAHGLNGDKSTGIPENLVEDFIVLDVPNNPVKVYETTISELNPDLLQQPVLLKDVQFSATSVVGTYADADNNKRGFLDLQDCDGNSVIVITSGYAKFAGEAVAKGKGDFIAVYTVYNDDKQLVIRSLEDVQLNGDRCGGSGGGEAVDSLDEGFEDSTPKADLVVEGWTNIATVGKDLWRSKEFSGNKYAIAQSYKSQDDNNEIYLISPAIKFNGKKKLSFRSAVAYYKHDAVKVYVSTNFDGFNPNGATWTELSCSLAGSGNGNYDWVESGEIDLSTISENGHIAFVYRGNKDNETTSFIVDNVKVYE